VPHIKEQFEEHGGTQELPKHVGDCVFIVFTCQCMQAGLIN
jgi:hypothetical protein